MNTEDTDRAKEQAKRQLEGIVDLMLRIEEADSSSTDYEDLEQKWDEDPLEVSVRCASWSTPHDDLQPDEYRVLLCTGGPAVQITGDLDERGCPTNATLQYQDWFTPWEDYRDISMDEADKLLTYVSRFFDW